MRLDGVIILFVVGFGGFGWIFNIVKLVQAMPEKFFDLSTFLVLRIVGIFVPPLGAILGYM